LKLNDFIEVVDKIGNEYSDGIWKVCCRRSPLFHSFRRHANTSMARVDSQLQVVAQEKAPQAHAPHTPLFLYIYFFFSGSDISGQGWQLVASCGPGEAPPAHAFFYLYIYIYLFFWERHKWPGLTASCRLWSREGPPGTRLFFIFYLFLQSL